MLAKQRFNSGAETFPDIHGEERFTISSKTKI